MIFTAQDFFEDLSDVVQRAADRLGGADVRRALIAAYDTLHAVRDWTVYQRYSRLHLQPAYTAGTIAYDHTGGAYERMVTLTGGTWPAWASDGTFRVGIERYQVEAVQSATVLTLDSQENPGADIAPLTAYQLSLERFPLPDDFQTNGEVVSSDGRDLTRISQSEWLEFQTLTGPRYGGPFRYAYIGDPHRPGKLMFVFDPSPGTLVELTFKYQRKPRPLAVILYDAGTAVTAAASASIVGSGTVWTAAMVGSVFRLSADKANPPTGLAGDNPAAFEARILAVADATHLTVDAPCPMTTAAGSYRISDPLDYEPGPMTEALTKRGAMLLLALRRDIKSNRNAMQEYQEALDLAKAADCKEPFGGTLTARRRSW